MPAARKLHYPLSVGTVGALFAPITDSPKIILARSWQKSPPSEGKSFGR